MSRHFPRFSPMLKKTAALAALLSLSGCAPIGVHGGFSSGSGYYQGYYTPYPYSGYYGGSVLFSAPSVYIGRPRNFGRPFRLGFRPNFPGFQRPGGPRR